MECTPNHVISKGSYFFAYCSATAAVSAIGIGLAAAATTIFPGVMLGVGSAALAGAIIAPTALILGFLVTDKVNNYIISPVVERFSSKEQEV